MGLTLAMDLAWRGIDVIVAETRYPGEPPSVKCNHVSARTMETFRRLGLSQKVRDAGLPADYPNDASYRTTSTGIEMARIPIPARNERYTATGGPDTWWPTSEPPHRINQTFLEPVMFAHAKAMPGVRILNRTRGRGFHARRARHCRDTARSRLRRDLSGGRKISRGLRRQPLADPPQDRCGTLRHTGDPARAIDLHSRAAIARHAAGQACLDVSVAQSTPLRHRDRNRRA